MEINDIKKFLYKEKLIAKLIGRSSDSVFYYAETGGKENIHFTIPIDEAKTFSKEEPAQLLIRWLVTDAKDSKPEYAIPFNDKGQFIGTD